MTNRSLLTFLLLATSGSLLAQTPTLRATGRLVVVDVVVTDANGHPVQNLSHSAFTVLESKTPQRVTSFEEHKAQSLNQPAIQSIAQPSALPAAAKLPPGTFTNVAVPPTTDSLNVLLLDTLNTPLLDQAVVRAQLLDYLKHAPAGVPIAIFGLSTQLHMLQGFTSDPAILKRIVEHQAGNPSRVLADPTTGAAPESFANQLSDAGFLTFNNPGDNLQRFLKIQQAAQETARVRYTLDAMNQLARYLANLPGRKNLIWFSGSFPLNILPDSNLNVRPDKIPTAGGAGAQGPPDPVNEFVGETYSNAEFRETATLLARSRVAVYPISAHGLQAYASYDASSGDGHLFNPTAMVEDSNKFTVQIAGEQNTMLDLAKDTGGQAYVNTNGLTAAVAKAVSTGSNFYTLAYTPSETHKADSFRPIQVTLAGAKYNLAYRRGYYSEESTSTKPTTQASAPQPDAAPVRRALIHGAPDSTEILFNVSVLPASTTTEMALAPNNTLKSTKYGAPYQRLAIHFTVDPHSIQFNASPDGNLHAGVDFVEYVYTPTGESVVSLIRNVTVNLSPAQYAQLLNADIPVNTEISVPADPKSPFYLRLLIHDRVSNHLGSMELPVAAVKNLSPTSISTAPSPSPASAH